MPHVRHHRCEQVGDALVHRQLQHLRIDHDHPHVGARRLVEKAQDHRVDGDGLARSGGSGHQEVGHAREVHHHRLSRDVLPETQCEMGGVGVVLAGLEHVAQHHDFPLLVGNLESDGGLAGDHLHDADTHRGQRPREVLGEVGHATHLQPGRRLKLVAGHHRAGVHRDHFGLDAEIGKLELDLAGYCLEGVVRHRLALLLRLVEQGERRQRAGARRRLEQGHLALALDPLAGPDLCVITGSMRGGLRRDLRLRSTSTLAPRSRFTRLASQRSCACTPRR